MSLSELDRPNSYIGRSVPRPNARKLAEGRGQFTDDIRLPRMAHVAFLRSPYAHARIVRIDTAKAAQSPGVFRVVTGREMAKVCTPWVGVLAHLKGMKSAPQHPIAVERACWQGEAVCAVVAQTRAQAEDALPLIDIEWQELPAITDAAAAAVPGSPAIHPELGDNICFQRELTVGEVDAAFKGADVVVEETYVTGRHTEDLPRAALDPRRFQPGRPAADGLSLDPGAAHDAERLCQASRPAGHQCAGDLPRCRRLVRH